MNETPPAGSHIHLIAICGVGMASLAGLLQARGYRVTGSDQNIYPPMSTYLASIGIDVLPGFRPEHLAPRPDLVIVGNAVSRANPEAQTMLEAEISHISFPQALGQFLIGRALFARRRRHPRQDHYHGAGRVGVCLRGTRSGVLRRRRAA